MFKKPIDPQKALVKAEKFCAYQERSHQEVRDKLYSYGLFRRDVEEILTHLITSGFLNEERFTKAFVGGKFRMKKWGRNKIEHELKRRNITPRCIQIGLKEIDEADYRKTLVDLIKKKDKTVTELNPFKRRNKLASFIIGKGFEPELVWSYLAEFIPD